MITDWQQTNDKKTPKQKKKILESITKAQKQLEEKNKVIIKNLEKLETMLHNCKINL